MISRNATALLACALTAAATPHAMGDYRYILLQAGTGVWQEPSEMVYGAKTSGKVTMMGAYGNYGMASGAARLTSTPRSCSIRMSAQAKAGAGPTFLDEDSEVPNTATAQADLTRGEYFTFTKPTRYRVSYMLSKGPGPLRYTGSSVNASIYRVITKDQWDPVDFWRTSYAGCFTDSGILPAGTYVANGGMYVYAPRVGVDPNDPEDHSIKSSQQSAQAAVRFEFGFLSPAARDWRKDITAFSNAALLLRGKAEQLRHWAGKEEARLAAAEESVPPVFDEAFLVTPHPKQKDRFTVTPRGSAHIAPFVETMTAVAMLCREVNWLHEELMDSTKQALKDDLLPHVTRMYLDPSWNLPTPSSLMQEGPEALSFYQDHAALTEDQVAYAKETYDKARDWLAGRPSRLQPRVDHLYRRCDALVSCIGLAAEEITRDIRKDTALDADEAKDLIDSLNMADRAWSE